MKICFVQQAFREQFGTMYLSAMLKQAGHETDIYIYNHDIDIPDADIYAVSSCTPTWEEDKKVIIKLKAITGKKIIVGGPHATFNPDEVIAFRFVDAVCVGEGYEALVEYANNPNNTMIKNIYSRFDIFLSKNEIRPLFDINKLPMPDYALYYDKYPQLAAKTTKQVYIVRGCPYQCLTGDTLVNTIYGQIKIKELVDKYKTIPVLTRNEKTNELIYVDAINIRKTGVNKELVRVNFDDGTFIECTPDHRFMTFKNGNQFQGITETETEAQDLKPMQRVRAVRYENQLQYEYIASTRHNARSHHRLIAEYKAKRKLESKDVVHHKDGNKKNNHPDNLEILTNSEHWNYHREEISERMKINNAAKNMSAEQRILNGKMQKGKVRTQELRIKYSESKKGENNPNYKTGNTVGYRSRLNDGIPNHKVVSVERLEKKEDVYCMEVPGYDWFYANNVLVHNCAFCYNPVVNKMYKDKGNILQYMDIQKAINEIKELKKRYGFTWLQFLSDTMNLDNEWFIAFLKAYKEQINTPYLCNVRVNKVTEELVKVMKETGCDRIDFGVEHGDEFIRNTVLKRYMPNDMITTAGNLFREYGIRVQTSNIMGLPEETLDKAIKSVKINQAFKPEIAKCCILQPFVGTDVYNYAKERNLLINEDQVCGTTYQRDFDGRNGITKIKLKDSKRIIRLSYLLDYFVQRPWLNPFIKIIVSLPLDFWYKKAYNKSITKIESKYK